MTDLQLQTPENYAMPDATPLQPALLLAPPIALGGTSLAALFAHPDVYLSENCTFLLPPLYALRGQGVKAEYHALQARQALVDFCEELPGGRADYLAAVARMGSELYGLAAAQAGCRTVLDANFRHCYVLEELAELYPEVRLVRLQVDPLTYLSAVVRNQCGGFPDRLQYCEAPFRELYGSYQRLARAQELFGERLLDLNYAELVAAPAAARKRLFSHLGLTDTPLPEDLPLLESPAEHLAYWQTAPERLRFTEIARDYLTHLGEELLAGNGWPLAGMLQNLAQMDEGGAGQ